MMSELPKVLQEGITKSLSEVCGGGVVLNEFSAVIGGCINNAGKLDTSEGSFFIKWNDAIALPQMFQAESRGLELLSLAKAIDIPEVICVGAVSSLQFLVLNYIDSHPKKHTYWKDLGEGVAALHKCTANKFGLDHSNYIGSLKQHNAPSENWIDFFAEERLNRQLRILESNKAVTLQIQKDLEALIKTLPDLLHCEPPSLLHGDLWNGNVMVNERGAPSLIDPAVYYGNREVDLAMTKLFGGFPDGFYDAYNNVFPLEKGFEIRFTIYNLYPLLVHTNLFGGGYLSQVSAIVKKFI